MLIILFLDYDDCPHINDQIKLLWQINDQTPTKALWKKGEKNREKGGNSPIRAKPRRHLCQGH